MSEPLFEQVRQESTRDKVYAAIRQAILSGKLKTGQRLTEIRLSREFQVSRAIVREALQQLAHEGLVCQSSYKGTRVVDLSPQEMEEILAVRTLLEEHAVRQAKRRMSDSDRKALKAILERLEEARRPPRDPQAHAQLDLALHSKIWQASGNQTLHKLLVQLTTPLFAMGSILRQAARPGSPGRSPGGHRDLVERICHGSEEQAAAAIRAHLAENRRLIRENLEAFRLRRDKRAKRRESHAGS